MTEITKNEDQGFYKYSAGLLVLDAVFILVTIALFVIFPPKIAFLYAVLFFVGCSSVLIAGVTVLLVIGLRSPRVNSD